MTGNNELRLNQATMIEALQLWINTKFVSGAPRVTLIAQLDSSTFSVQLTDERDES